MSAEQATQLIDKLDTIIKQLNFISAVLFRWDSLFLVCISVVLVTLFCYLCYCFLRFFVRL